MPPALLTDPGPTSPLTGTLFGNTSGSVWGLRTGTIAGRLPPPPAGVAPKRAIPKRSASNKGIVPLGVRALTRSERYHDPAI